jgi:imidazolonepropionase-like amidohydrolase
MRKAVHVPRPKHKTPSQLKWIPAQLVLTMPLGSSPFARGGIVPSQQVQNICRPQFNRFVRLFLLINQKWKCDSRLFSKHFRILRIPKTHRRQCRSFRPKLLLKCAQLRDVLPAEDSTIVPQEHHDRGLRRPKRTKPPFPPIRIRQHNHRQSAAQRSFHGSSLRKCLETKTTPKAYIAIMRNRFTILPFLLLILFACDSIRAADLAPDLALTGAKIYASPTESAIENGTILVHGGRIVAVGPSAKIKVPHDATVIDCKGLVVTAGFWNSHVHILTPGLLHAEKTPSPQITSQLEAMLTRWGFTTVFDIGSVLGNTALIRHRIETGEVKGPKILTTGEPFWGKGGTPIYVKGFLEANHINIPDVESPAQGTKRVQGQIREGADGIKIFAGSVEAGSILIMPLDLAKAIVAEAHRAGKPVFAHPSNRQGIELAIQSGVDILAHTTPEGGPWSQSLVETLKAKNMALIPTLTLWHAEAKSLPPADFEKGMNEVVLPQLRAYSEAGGQILFGTDVGYIEQFDTSEEFTWMSRAGMSFQQILASLTTSPAQRFGFASHAGRIAKGMDADFVILSGDPASDVTAFSKVRYTIRDGKVLYSEK